MKYLILLILISCDYTTEWIKPESHRLTVEINGFGEQTFVSYILNDQSFFLETYKPFKLDTVIQGDILLELGYERIDGVVYWNWTTLGDSYCKVVIDGEIVYQNTSNIHREIITTIDNKPWK